jgi:hypothetical protein
MGSLDGAGGALAAVHERGIGRAGYLPDGCLRARCADREKHTLVVAVDAGSQTAVRRGHAILRGRVVDLVQVGGRRGTQDLARRAGDEVTLARDLVRDDALRLGRAICDHDHRGGTGRGGVARAKRDGPNGRGQQDGCEGGHPRGARASTRGHSSL